MEHMCSSIFALLHHNISKVVVKVLLDLLSLCAVQQWTDLLSDCFCKPAPFTLHFSLLNWTSQGYTEVSHCHMASQCPNDVMLLLHNLWRLLFLQMRCTITLPPTEFHASVCLLWSVFQKTTKNNLHLDHCHSLTSASDRRSGYICSATIKRAFITDHFGTHWEFKTRC